MVLCITPFINAAALAPQPVAPSDLLQPSVSTRTVGPPPSWSRTYGKASDDRLFSMVQCSSGGYALTGQTQSYGHGDVDAYLVRTDINGNHLWNKTFGGAHNDFGNAIVELSDGFAIAGYSNSYSASYDGWLIRTDSNGNHQWNVTYGGIDPENLFGLVACTGGGFAMAGYTYSYGAGASDAWLVRTDSCGVLLWNKTYGELGMDIGNDLVECSAGGFAIIGKTVNYGAVLYDA